MSRDVRVCAGGLSSGSSFAVICVNKALLVGLFSCSSTGCCLTAPVDLKMAISRGGRSQMLAWWSVTMHN